MNHHGTVNLDIWYKVYSPCCRRSTLLLKGQKKQPYHRKCSACWTRYTVAMEGHKSIWKLC